MKKASIILIILGIALLLFGTIFYGHTSNMVDSGGSAVITTFNGHWSVQIPAFFGGVMLLLGAILYYVDYDRKKRLSHS